MRRRLGLRAGPVKATRPAHRRGGCGATASGIVGCRVRGDGFALPHPAWAGSGRHLAPRITAGPPGWPNARGPPAVPKAGRARAVALRSGAPTASPGDSTQYPGAHRRAGRVAQPLSARPCQRQGGSGAVSGRWRSGPTPRPHRRGTAPGTPEHRQPRRPNHGPAKGRRTAPAPDPSRELPLSLCQRLPRTLHHSAQVVEAEFAEGALVARDEARRAHQAHMLGQQVAVADMALDRFGFHVAL